MLYTSSRGSGTGSVVSGSLAVDMDTRDDCDDGRGAVAFAGQSLAGDVSLRLRAAAARCFRTSTGNRGISIVQLGTAAWDSLMCLMYANALHGLC
jgi:hypothetical protein